MNAFLSGKKEPSERAQIQAEKNAGVDAIPLSEKKEFTAYGRMPAKYMFTPSWLSPITVGLNTLLLLGDLIVLVLGSVFVFTDNWADLNATYYNPFMFTNHAVDPMVIFVEFSYILWIGYQMFFSSYVKARHPEADSYYNISSAPGIALVFRISGRVSWAMGVPTAYFALSFLECVTMGVFFWCAWRYDRETHNPETDPITIMEKFCTRIPNEIILTGTIFATCGAFMGIFIWEKNPNAGWSQDFISDLILGIIVIIITVSMAWIARSGSFIFIFMLANLVLGFSQITVDETFWKVALGMGGFLLLEWLVLMMTNAFNAGWATWRWTVLRPYIAAYESK